MIVEFDCVFCSNSTSCGLVRREQRQKVRHGTRRRRKILVSGLKQNLVLLNKKGKI